MSTISENGKTYTIEDGRVVAAVAESQEEVVDTPLKFDDRVAYGKKLGSVISLVPTVYGLSVGVKFDDGSYDNFVPESLQLAPVAKEAGAVTAEGFEAEYAEYEAMTTDSLEEVESKIKTARSLNLRAKANATNSKNALADTILYDRVVTATGLDIHDLEQDRENWRVVESADYLESLPQFEVQESVGGFGMNRGGDLSWIDEAAEDFSVNEITEADLAGRAAQAVAQLTPEQLEDKEFMRTVLNYGFEYLPTDKEARVKFASFVNEARKTKLAEVEGIDKTASVDEKQYDLDGEEFDLDSLPVDAVFGV